MRSIKLYLSSHFEGYGTSRLALPVPSIPPSNPITPWVFLDLDFGRALRLRCGRVVPARRHGASFLRCGGFQCRQAVRPQRSTARIDS